MNSPNKRHTEQVEFEHRCDAIPVRSLPADPPNALIGSAKPIDGLTSGDIRKLSRDEDTAAEEGSR